MSRKIIVIEIFPPICYILFMAILESGEMYLETILILSREKLNIRAIDICSQMGFSKPSVSRGLKLLKEEHMIYVDENGYIFLTDEGKIKAENVYERHNVLTEALMMIGISKEIAEDDACKIEHIISDETFEKIKKHLKKSCHTDNATGG